MCILYGSVTLRHSSANSTNRGSCIASCIACSGLGELSIDTRRSRRCGFCKICRIILLFSGKQTICILAPWWIKSHGQPATQFGNIPSKGLVLNSELIDWIDFSWNIGLSYTMWIFLLSYNSLDKCILVCMKDNCVQYTS